MRPRRCPLVWMPQLSNGLILSLNMKLETCDNINMHNVCNTRLLPMAEVLAITERVLTKLLG
jgi:hypothetical protein